MMFRTRVITLRIQSMFIRTGLRAGLDCTKTDKGSYFKYACGNTSCNKYKELPNWGCSVANKPGFFPGTGLDAMNKFIAQNNNVSPDAVKLG